jgi:hypothetical protein
MDLCGQHRSKPAVPAVTQSEVILVSWGAGHVDIFSERDGACQHTTNFILCILHDVFGTISCIGFWRTRVWAVLAAMFTGYESLQSLRSQVTCCMTTLWFVYSKFMKSKDLILNMCSSEDTCTQTLHESELSFMYHIFLYPGKLWIYHTSKLLCIFQNTLY